MSDQMNTRGGPPNVASLSTPATTVLRLPDIVEGDSTSVGARAFQCQDWITQVIIPEGYTKIDTGAFHKCFNVCRVTLPATLTTIGDRAFHECLRLEEINLERVKHIGKKAFAGKANNVNALGRLQTIDLASVETIGERAFADCGLKLANLLANVQTIGKEAFRGAHLNAFECGEHLTAIGQGAFQSSNICSMNLTQCKHLTAIGCLAFFDCMHLVCFLFPEENKLYHLQNNLFKNCQHLEEIVLPEGLIEIGDGCFGECERLERVTWPTSLQRVGGFAFGFCGALYTPSMAKKWQVGSNAFFRCKVPLFDSPNALVEISAEKLNGYCSICLDRYTTDSTCQLSCGHLFHQECGRKWYKTATTCPNCRQTVTSVATVVFTDVTIPKVTQ